MNTNEKPPRAPGAKIYWLFAFGFAVHSLFGLVPASIAIKGTITWDTAAFLGLALLVPILAICVGIKYRAQPHIRRPFFYRVLLPLYAFALFYLFMNTRLTFAIGFFMAMPIGASVYAAAQLFSLVRPGSWADLFGATVQAWFAAWFMLLLLCLSPVIIEAIFLIALPILGLKPLLGLVLIAFYALFSIVLYRFTSYQWDSFSCYRRATKRFGFGKPGVYFYRAGALAVITLAFALSARTDYAQVLRTAATFPATNYTLAEAEKKKAADSVNHLKEQLTQIYLAPFLYPCDAKQLHSKIRLVVSYFFAPLVYSGSGKDMQTDQHMAARHYRKLFGVSIEDGEARRIKRITGADKAQFAVPAAYGKRGAPVYVSEQNLSIEENGEWADIELHEVYRNVTSPRDEKVTLHFSLPAGTVITGLWLSDDESKKFAAVIAPRGAAQKTFNAIVRQGQDPALVEETAPGCYRLQIYPVPRAGAAQNTGAPFHVWLRFRSLKQKSAEWYLPTLLAGQNFRWDADTIFTLNGMRRKKGNAWLPESLPATGRSTPAARTMNMFGCAVTMEPKENVTLPAPGALAVFIDTSSYMEEEQEALLQHMEAIHRQWKGPVVPYVWGDDGWQPVRHSLKDRLARHIFWGALRASDLAREIAPTLPEGTPILVLSKKNRIGGLTDRGTVPYRWAAGVDSEESSPETEAVTAVKVSLILRDIRTAMVRRTSPGIAAIDERYVWFVQRNEAAPIAEPIATPIAEPIATPTAAQIATPTAAQIATPTAAQIATAIATPIAAQDNAPGTSLEGARAHIHENETLEALFVHTLVSFLGKEAHTGRDALQELAVAGKVVTPYSSMIALVADWQRELLAQAAKESDRFSHNERSLSDGSDIFAVDEIRQPGNKGAFAPDIMPTAVPEPEEWALIIAGALLLLHKAYRRRSAMCYGRAGIGGQSLPTGLA